MKIKDVYENELKLQMRAVCTFMTKEKYIILDSTTYS